MLATAVAVVPGFVVGGTGQWASGHPCTARRLLATEGIGLAGMGLGIATLALTGGSQYLATPAILASLGGLGLVMTAFGAGVYGASGVALVAGEPLQRRPTWQAELGVLHVYSPLLPFRWLYTQVATLSIRRTSVNGALETAPDKAHARYRLGTALRLAGVLPDEKARDGSYLDLQLEFGEQRFTTLGFVTDNVDLLASGRLDLVRVSPLLKGSFTAIESGLSLSRTSYRIDGIAVRPDYETMLLGRVAFGVYLGRGKHRGSEAALYYDHRRDDYAAGLKFWGYGNGMLGHFGLNGRYFFSKYLGIAGTAEAGSAYVVRGAIVFRSGE